MAKWISSPIWPFVAHQGSFGSSTVSLPSPRRRRIAPKVERAIPSKLAIADPLNFSRRRRSISPIRSAGARRSARRRSPSNYLGACAATRRPSWSRPHQPARPNPLHRERSSRLGQAGILMHVHPEIGVGIGWLRKPSFSAPPWVNNLWNHAFTHVSWRPVAQWPTLATHDARWCERGVKDLSTGVAQIGLPLRRLRRPTPAARRVLRPMVHDQVKPERSPKDVVRRIARLSKPISSCSAMIAGPVENLVSGWAASVEPRPAVGGESALPFGSP